MTEEQKAAFVFAQAAAAIAEVAAMLAENQRFDAALCAARFSCSHYTARH